MVKHSHTDNLIARYGGNEFAILPGDAPEAGASCYAERMRRTQADHPFSHARQVIASFGVASLPEDSIASAERLIRAADEALYEAKRGGKNTVASYAPETILAQAQRNSPHTSPSLRVVHPRSSKPCCLS